jgi:hypothetical protein
VIGVGVRENGPIDRFPRINVHTGGGAIDSFVGESDHDEGGTSNLKPRDAEKTAELKMGKIFLNF